MSGFCYLHSSFSGTSYRCGLNENMFGFRWDPTRGMGRKNLGIIFCKVKQLPLPSGGGLEAGWWCVESWSRNRVGFLRCI